MQDHVDSYYAATANSRRRYAPLADSMAADVCVIGGGYTGVSCALHLAERGYKVVLLEAARIGWGASGRNGGEMFTGQRKSQEELERRFGREKARALWKLGLEAVELVLGRIAKHCIECDLKSGIVVAAAKRGDAETLRRNAAKMRDDYAYPDVRFVERDELAQMIGTDRYFGGTLNLGCYHLHPLNLVTGFAGAASDAGAQLFEQSRVLNYSRTDPATIRTDRGEVRARYVVLACDAYLGKLEPAIAGHTLPINNFMLATEPFSEAAAQALIPGDHAVSDTKFVVNYWRFSADRRLLFGGGESYSSRFPDDIRAFVRKFMLRIYPQLGNVKVDFGWGGSVGVTVKRLPHFGRLGPNVFFAQGYSGQGIALANLAGKLIAEALAGTAERFDIMAGLPSPAFPGGTLLQHPLMVLGMLYYALLDRL